MAHKSYRKLLIVPALLGAGAALPAQAPSPAPSASALPRVVKSIEAGHWEFRDVVEGGKPLHLCLGDKRQLFQFRHPAPMCRQFVGTNEPEHAVVSYDCEQRGQGRTDLRVETPRLIQIDSRGIADGAPFATRLEGRRIGACPRR